MIGVLSFRRCSAAAWMAAVIAGISPALAQGVPQGRLGVLPHGYWQCGTPGDAMGVAFAVADKLSFATRANSSYRSQEGRGTYLLIGTRLTFTRGPLNGRAYRWESKNRVRALERDGSAGRLICNRRAHRRDNPFSDPSGLDKD